MSSFIPIPIAKPDNLNGRIIASPSRDVESMGITEMFSDLGRVIQSTTETIAGTTANVLGGIAQVEQARKNSEARVRPDDQSSRGSFTRVASNNKDQLFVFGGLALGAIGIYIALT